MFGMGADGAGFCKCHHGVWSKKGEVFVDCPDCREEAETEKARRDAEYDRTAAIKKAEEEARCTPLVEADWVKEVEDYDHETGREFWVTREEFLSGFTNPNQPVFDKKFNAVRSSMGAGGMRHDWR